MLAATPAWVGDATAWATLVTALAAALFVLWRPIRRGLREVIHGEVGPLADRLRHLEGRLVEHMTAEERSAADIAARLERIERATAAQVRDVAAELAAHRIDPDAHNR